MGKFSDQVRRKYASKNKVAQGEIEFECNNCLNIFNFSFKDILLNKSGDIEFIPEPSCPGCGSRVEIMFSDRGQEKIEDMLFKGEIRKG